MARSVRLALEGEFVPDAVNVQGGVVAEDLRPWLPLGEKLGRIFAALAGGATASVAMEAKGEIAGLDVSVLELAAMKGLFGDVTEEPVTYVNAPLVAKERGVEVRPRNRRGEPGLAKPADRSGAPPPTVSSSR